MYPKGRWRERGINYYNQEPGYYTLDGFVGLFEVKERSESGSGSERKKVGKVKSGAHALCVDQWVLPCGEEQGEGLKTLCC
jgi:hypothetical protein